MRAFTTIAQSPAEAVVAVDQIHLKWTNLNSVPPSLVLTPIFGRFVGHYGSAYASIISDIVTCMT